MEKYSIISLGCPKNLVDSERFRYILSSNDIMYTENIQEADYIVINTCGFIQEAKEESISCLLETATIRNSKAKIIATGCLVQRYYHDLKRELKEIDYFVKLKDFESFSKIFGLKSDRRLKRYIIPGKTYAYLRISDGCNNNCSYCVIPLIRGSLKSEPIEDLLSECEILADAGVKELILTAQDITQYGLDLNGESKLVELLKKIVALGKFKWIRLLYLHPAHINQELLEFIRTHVDICNYLDIPLQHISDPLLKAMNRGITKKEIIELLLKIRKIIPGIALRTTFITGFPGESTKDYLELKRFISEMEFDKLGVFSYSDEEGSASFSFPGKIKRRTAQNRKNSLMRIQQAISEKKMSSFVGKELDVLIEKKSEDEGFLFEARTEFDAPEIDGVVFIRKGKAVTGEIKRVKVIDSWEYDLVADIVE